MEEDQKSEAGRDEQGGGKQAKDIDFSRPDFFLQCLVDLANRYGTSFGVTLNVGGFLVSGYTASGKDFFDAVGRMMGQSFANNTEVGASVEQYFKRFGEIYVFEGSDEERELPGMIHLKDARYFHHSGKPIPSNQSLWWRGRLSSVAGFSMGNLSHE